MGSNSIMSRLLYFFVKKSRTMAVEAEELGPAMINATLCGYELQTLENVDIRKPALMNCSPI